MMRHLVFGSAYALVLAAGCGDSGDTTGSGGGGTGGATTAASTTSGTGGAGDDPCEESWALAGEVATTLGCMGTPMADPCPNIRAMAEAQGCVAEYEAAYECVVTQTIPANMECKPMTDTVGFIMTPCTTEANVFTTCLQ